jgi:cytochrome c oxidase subunit 2
MTASPGQGLSSVFLTGSTQADVLAEVSWLLIGGTGAVFLITMALAAWSLRTHERRVSTAWWVVAGGLVFPITVLTALLIYSTWRTQGLDRPFAAPPMVIGVTGHMWWWEVRIHDPATGQEIRTANEIHLPAGQPVQLGLTAADVIHSFWVPSLGGKMDMVPGRVNRLMIQAHTPGVYRGQCAEYCGAQHARMGLRVIVQPPQDHAKWLAAQRAPAALPRTPRAIAGRQALHDHGCLACHAVRGVSDDGRGGPDLTHVASRDTLGAGTLRNHQGALLAWIRDVQALKPGSRMASYHHLDEPALQAIAAYLSELK